MSIKNKYNLFSKKVELILIVFFLFSAALLPRFYGIDNIPPSISWDEAAVGVNGWSIVNFGTDEWGSSFPLTFHSFGDDKNPIHIYVTSVSIGFFGLNEFAIRLPVAILGIANVLLLFWLGTKLFKSKVVGFIAAVSLALSPYSIIFSRFNHELNFTIFFFLLGVLLFFLGLERKRIFIFLAFICFSIDLLTYNSAKVVVPIIVLYLIATNIKKLLLGKASFFAGCILFFGLIIAMLTNPQLAGLNRAAQNNFSENELIQTSYFKQTKNIYVTKFLITGEQYFKHFSYNYLFKSGDNNPRHSTQQFGQFYQFELILMLIGLLMIIKLKTKESVLLLLLLIIAPIPSALFKEAPHSARAMFMMSSTHLLIGLGGDSLIKGFLYLKDKKTILRFKNQSIAGITISLLLLCYMLSIQSFMSYYLFEYPKKYAIEWQFGMKEIADYIKSHPNLEKIYITDSRSQPYIFMRFYDPIDPKSFAFSAILDSSDQRLSNIVESYGKYTFGRWDKINSEPKKGSLHVLTPSEYSGLQHITKFEVKKVIKYPNDTDAFFIIEGTE